MYKGLSEMKPERRMKSAGCLSYSKRQIVPSKCIAVCFATFALVSCEKNNGHSMFQASESAVNSYRAYLSEMRSVESLSTEHLIEAVNDWQTLRDSVFACVAKDTANRIHSNHENTIHSLHDSLQAEFIRLAHSTPKTFKDVLLIRERTSPYRQDAELAKTVEAAKPFFESLDSIQPYQRTAKNIVSAYETFLAKTMESGICSNEELLAFIREEDSFFRSFLAHLPELAGADLSAITHRTEKCCLSVFQSAESGRLPYQDALIYFTKRTNRRIVLNASACMDDINHDRVRTATQARAYVWMLLQPYIALDGFGMAVLSDKEKAILYDVAEQMPSIMTGLNRITGTDNSQWESLPDLLVKVMLTSI